jgi:hypothetical protein
VATKRVPRYCEECGAKLAMTEVDGYDPNTGKRKRVMACSNIPCHTVGHKWTHHDAKWMRLPYQGCEYCGLETGGDW